MDIRLGAAILMMMTNTAAADTLKCDVCETGFFGKYYHVEDQAVGGEKIVCPNCAELPDRCFACGLPVKTNFETLPDGRVLCARDFKAAIQSEDDAKAVCEQVRDDLDRLLSRFMTYPDKNVIVSIVNRFYLENLFHSPGEGQACVSIYGATTSNPLPGGKIVHSVNVLSHLRKAQLMAVCAHEYTHAWMGENVTAQRKAAMDKNIVEAFCELVAYKYMESQHQDFEMERIKKNNYTQGRIDILIAADAKYGFNTIVEWIKSGDDRTLEMDNLDRIRGVHGNYVRSTTAPAGIPMGIPVAALIAPAPPAPTTLVLKGISGSGQHRFALINNTTFETMEKAHVHLGQTNLTVLCLEIHDDSVIVQIDGSAEKKKLVLRSEQ